MILSCVKYPVPVVKEFLMDVIVLEIETPITNGQEFIFYSKSDKSTGKITKIHKITQGSKTKKFSPIIPKNHSATIEVKLDSGLCLEVSANYNPLGRLSLRDKGVTLACGIVTKLIK